MFSRAVRSALALGLALGDGGRAVGVEREGVALDHALQVGAQVVGVWGLRLHRVGRAGVVHGFERQQRLARGQIVARCHGQRLHTPGVGRLQHMLHLHGFEHGQVGAGSHHVTHGHGELHQARRHGCADGVGVGSGAAHCGRFLVILACSAYGISAGSYLFCSLQQLGQHLLDPARVHLLVGHFGARGQGAQQRQVAGHALDAALGQRALRAAQHVGKVAAGRGHDELGQQRVVVRRGCQAGHAVRVHAHARAAGQVKARQGAAAGAGVALGVERFGVDAPLDGVALRARWCRRVQCKRRQAAPGRHGDLQLHQVKPGDGFGHGVLDLQARVGFDKDKRQVAGGQIDQKLKRAQALVGHGARHAQRGVGQLHAQRLGQRGAGRDFDQFLKAPLQRAFALAQRHHAGAVAQHLHLDVARAGHQALGVHAIDPERGQRFRAATRVGRGQGISLQHRTHAAPAAAAHRLEHGAGAALRGKKGLRLFQRHGAGAARHHRHAALLRQRTGAGLVAKQRQLRGRGADKAQACVLAGLGEVGALAQKAIARVHGIATRGERDGDQVGGVEVRGRAGGLQRHGLASGGHMRRVRVVVGVHGHAGNAQVVQRAHQAQRNFATVGDQNLGEQGGSGHAIGSCKRG